MKGTLSLEMVMRLICNHYQVTERDVKDKKRTKYIVKARQMFMYYSSLSTKESSTKIGQFINRNHGTVLYSINKIEGEKEHYKDVLDSIEIISKEVNSFIIPIDIDLLKLTKNYNASFI